MNISQLLNEEVSHAMQAVGIPADAPAVIKASARPEFGDYQANGIMGAAKRLKSNPRELASKVVEHLQTTLLQTDNKLPAIAEKIEVAGPGFINIHLNLAWLGQNVLNSLNSDTLGVDKTQTPQTVVVDYSSPNLAKEMHVGHLRSTIIGDAVVRTLDFLGHQVIRQNHVGDWGTQFGMLIAHMVDLQGDDNELSMQLADLEVFYQQAKKRFDDDTDFAAKARHYVVKLQGGDKECLLLWQQFIDISLQHCEALYQRLNVLLTRTDVKPESAYNDDLPHVVADLDKAGLLSESDGAQCVFLDEFKGKDDKPLPAIIKKSDGGYLYATSDLAALRYRHNQLNADRILYFVDARQNLHLNQVFAIAKKAGFIPQSMQTEHMAFGTMMGKDGKPFKTRAGGTVKLADLLTEAEERAYQLVSEKNPDLSEDEKQHIGKVVGIGSVKYADLSKNRTSDYIFNWETMLSFEGNTAPYLQYAFVRVKSIFDKVENYQQSDSITLSEPAERQLAIKLLQLTEAIEIVGKEGTPHTLCTYLHELAGNFMSFYEACPILKEGVNETVRQSRLALADMTAKTLKTGLDLLGIKTLNKM